MFCSSVWIRRIAATVIDKIALTFITGEMLASSCFISKVNGMLHQKEVVTQLSPLLVFTYSYLLQRGPTVSQFYSHNNNNVISFSARKNTVKLLKNKEISTVRS